MNRIYIVRHGQDHDNAAGILNGHRNTELTQKGVEQAHLLAQKIAKVGLRIDTTLSSPLRRALDTARIIASDLKISSPVIEPMLIERDFGIMTGKLVSDVTAICSPDIIKVQSTNHFLHPEGAETYPELINRAHMLLEKLNSNIKNQNILLVSHGDIGKMIYASYFQLDWATGLQQFYFGNGELIELSPDHNFKNCKIISQDQFNN
jgi:broad specificity phosphatase PhoE